MHLEIKQMFLRTHLEEAVNLIFPTGCGNMNGEVVLLQRAEYGLRQPDKRWSFRLSGLLPVKTDVEKSKASPCVFCKLLDGKVSLVVC